MKTEIMLYWRSLKKVQKLFPETVFEGFENAFGEKCWVSINSSEKKFTIIRRLLENKIKLLIVR